MKECKKCHTQYDDMMSFCTKCGTALPTSDGSSTPTPMPPVTPVKKKGGCLKKIIIGVVVLIIAVFMLFHYLLNAATYLRLEPAEVVAPKAGGECDVDIDYDGYTWTINHTPDWVIIAEYDTKFSIRLAPNTTGNMREGSITVQSGKHNAQMSVKQLGVATTIRLGTTSMKFPKEGGELTTELTTDGCNLIQQKPDWITVSRDDDNLIINCSSNSGNYRYGTVTIKEDYATASIFVTQAGKCEHCGGSGSVQCSMCYGLGHRGYGIYYEECMMCGSTGQRPCIMCGGTGEKQ